MDLRPDWNLLIRLQWTRMEWLGELHLPVRFIYLFACLYHLIKDSNVQSVSVVADLPAIFGVLFPDRDELYIPPGDDLDSLIGVLEELELIENDVLAEKQLKANQVSAVGVVQEHISQQKRLEEQLRLLAERYTFSRTMGTEEPVITDNLETRELRWTKVHSLTDYVL